MKTLTSLPILKTADDFSYFYTMSREAVFRRAFHLMKCSWEAEEITQEVFIKVWLMKAQWVFIHDWNNYLFVMTRNLAVTRLKKKMFQRCRTEDWRQFTQYDDFENEELDQARQERFSLAVTQLPVQQRIICELRIKYNWKQKKIAEVLELSPHTVKTQIANAKNNMRKYVKEMVA